MSAEKTTDFLGHLVELSAPLDKRLIKTRKGPGGKDLDFAEWHTIVDRLNAAVPEWRFEIKNLIPMGDGDFVCHGALTIDGVTRENVGAGDGNADKGPKSAVSDCIKRCAILFGLGLELYRDAQQQAWAVKRNEIAARKIAELKAVPGPSAGPDLDAEAAKTLASAPEPEPIEEPRPPKPDHIARTLSALLTPKQIVQIKVIANKAGVDADAECREMYECDVTELTKDAANALIEHLKARVTPEPTPEVDEKQAALDAQAPTPASDPKALRREQDGRALASAGYVRTDPKRERQYLVRSSSKESREYLVKRDHSGRVVCACADFEHNGKDAPGYRCIHLHAVKHFLANPPAVPTVSETQVADFASALDEKGVKASAWCAEHGYRSLAEIPASEYEDALASLY